MAKKDEEKKGLLDLAKKVVKKKKGDKETAAPAVVKSPPSKIATEPTPTVKEAKEEEVETAATPAKTKSPSPEKPDPIAELEARISVLEAAKNFASTSDLRKEVSSIVSDASQLIMEKERSRLGDDFREKLTHLIEEVGKWRQEVAEMDIKVSELLLQAPKVTALSSLKEQITEIKKERQALQADLAKIAEIKEDILAAKDAIKSALSDDETTEIEKEIEEEDEKVSLDDLT